MRCARLTMLGSSGPRVFPNPLSLSHALRTIHLAAKVVSVCPLYWQVDGDLFGLLHTNGSYQLRSRSGQRFVQASCAQLRLSLISLSLSLLSHPPIFSSLSCIGIPHSHNSSASLSYHTLTYSYLSASALFEVISPTSCS